MIQIIGGTFIINSVVAALWSYSLFSIIERKPKWSVPFGMGTGIPYIGALYWIGETQLTVSVSEMKWLIIAAVIGAIIGIGVIVTGFKPETE